MKSCTLGKKKQCSKIFVIPSEIFNILSLKQSSDKIQKLQQVWSFKINVKNFKRSSFFNPLTVLGVRALRRRPRRIHLVVGVAEGHEEDEDELDQVWIQQPFL